MDRTEPAFEPPKPPAHADTIETGEQPEKEPEETGAETPASLQDDVDGELLYSVEAVGGHGCRLR